MEQPQSNIVKRATVEVLSQDGKTREKFYFISEISPYILAGVPPEEINKEEEKHIDRVMADLIPLLRMAVSKVIFSKEVK